MAFEDYLDQMRNASAALRSAEKAEFFHSFSDTLLACLLFRFSSHGSTIVAPSVTSVSTLILAANPLRKGLIFQNSGGNVVFVAFAEMANTTDQFTLRLTANESWFMSAPTYTGAISAIRSSGNGVLNVTELV